MDKHKNINGYLSLIFGDRWKTMKITDKEVARETLLWCRRHEDTLSEMEENCLPSLEPMLDLAVESYFGVSLLGIMKKNRRRQNVERRNKVFYVYRNIGGFTLARIGEKFHYHHTTIIDSLRNVDYQCKNEEYNQALKSFLEYIKNTINQI